MKLDNKYLPWIFSDFDYRGIENKLVDMAEKGWEIQSVGGFLWKFKKVTPTKKKYSVLFEDNSPRDIGGQKMLAAYSNHKKWQKVKEWKQMRIFSAEENAEIPSAFDEAIRLETACSAMKKSFLPSLVMGFLLMTVLAVSNGVTYFSNSEYGDQNTIWAFLLTLYAAFCLGTALLGYVLWIQKSKKSIASNKGCISAHWHRNLQNILFVGFWILVVMIGLQMIYAL